MRNLSKAVVLFSAVLASMAGSTGAAKAVTYEFLTITNNMVHSGVWRNSVGATAQFNLGIIVSPDWSGDGTKMIYFAWNPSRTLVQLKTALISGTNATPVATFPSSQQIFHAAINRAGTRIAFMRSHSAGLSSLWVMNFDGSGLRQIAPPLNNNREPHFSWDGTQVYYQSNAGGNIDIYAFDLATNQNRRVTTRPEAEENPFPFPDGRIGFASGGKVYTLPANGGAGRSLVPIPIVALSPAVTPDGQAIIARGGGVHNMFMYNFQTRRVTTIPTSVLAPGPWLSGNIRMRP
jgi:TolB protein